MDLIKFYEELLEDQLDMIFSRWGDRLVLTATYGPALSITTYYYGVKVSSALLGDIWLKWSNQEYLCSYLRNRSITAFTHLDEDKQVQALINGIDVPQFVGFKARYADKLKIELIMGYYHNVESVRIYAPKAWYLEKLEKYPSMRDFGSLMYGFYRGFKEFVFSLDTPLPRFLDEEITWDDIFISSASDARSCRYNLNGLTAEIYAKDWSSDPYYIVTVDGKLAGEDLTKSLVDLHKSLEGGLS